MDGGKLHWGSFQDNLRRSSKEDNPLPQIFELPIQLRHCCCTPRYIIFYTNPSAAILLRFPRLWRNVKFLIKSGDFSGPSSFQPPVQERRQLQRFKKLLSVHCVAFGLAMTTFILFLSIDHCCCRCYEQNQFSQLMSLEQL